MKQHEICSLPECAMSCFSDLAVDVSRALAISQRKHDAIQLSKQTKGHELPGESSQPA